MRHPIQGFALGLLATWSEHWIPPFSLQDIHVHGAEQSQIALELHCTDWNPAYAHDVQGDGIGDGIPKSYSPKEYSMQ